jgi:hypothetical protein
MNPKPVLSVVLVLVLSVVACSCGTYLRAERLTKEGNEIVGKVESFRKDKGRLPDSLSELGIKETEGGPIYYAKKSDTKYLLWFGAELGESVSYDSDSKKWGRINK